MKKIYVIACLIAASFSVTVNAEFDDFDIISANEVSQLEKKMSDIHIVPPRKSQIRAKWKKAIQAQTKRAKKAPVTVTALGNYFLKEDSFSLTDGKYPTGNAIKALVEKYWPDLGSVNVRAFEGGSFTGALFSVARTNKPNDNIFFVKVSGIDPNASPDDVKRAQQAAIHLTDIQNSPIGRLISEAKSHYKNYFDLPILTIVERLFSYTDSSKQEHSIEVTHAARGQQLFSYLMDRVYLPPDTSFEEIGKDVGKAMGSFHSECMKSGDVMQPATWRTAVHGDLHPQNLFFHKTKDFVRTYFIDNESMAKSLTDPASILKDVTYMVFVPTIHWGSFIAPKWYNFRSFFKGLLMGYISAYHQKEQANLTAYLKEEFLNRLNELITIRDAAKLNKRVYNGIKLEQLFFFYVPLKNITSLKQNMLDDLMVIVNSLTDNSKE